MIGDSCPVPNKKQRTLSSPETSDNEELNLSRKFDEDYQILMNEEILKICKQPFQFKDTLENHQLFPDFISRCDSVLRWIEDCSRRPRQIAKCRCDKHLDKYENIMCKKLLESPRFTSINSLANVMISNQPHLASAVQGKLDELEGVYLLKYQNMDIDLSSLVKDLHDDINDLESWFTDVHKKLNIRTDKHRQMFHESIENILTDFKYHDDINNSITKMIENVIQLDSKLEYRDILEECKIKLNSLISHIHGQWIKAMELKFKLEMPNKCNSNLNRTVNMLGQESGFESEISPINPVRGFPKSNLYLMKYISSSGECEADNNTTDLPIDSDSNDFCLDITDSKDISSSSTSLVNVNMLKVDHFSLIAKSELNAKKKQKKLRKRRKYDSRLITHGNENLSPMGKENYLQKQNNLYKQSHSLKRRISEASSNQTLNENDEKTCKISDLAAAAENFFMKNNLNYYSESLCESAKESELDDGYCIRNRFTNDINVKENWDNYQASLYSNDDGDSQIIEVDKIKDWDHDLETDDQDCERILRNRPWHMLTSGYETSIESDMHLCNSNLINILQFSKTQQLDSCRYLDLFKKKLEYSNNLNIEKLSSAIHEQLSVSKTHLKLLDQILNNDSCLIYHDESLFKQICSLKNIWEYLIKEFTIFQSQFEKIHNDKQLHHMIKNIDEIESKLPSPDSCNDLHDIKSYIDLLKEHESRLSSIHSKILTLISDGQHILEIDPKIVTGRIEMVNNKIGTTLQTFSIDAKILTLCMEKLKTSQNSRELIETKLQGYSMTKSNDWETLSKEVLMMLERDRSALEICLKELSGVSMKKCCSGMSKNLLKELKLLDDLHDRLKVAFPFIENFTSKMGLLNDKSEERPNTSLLRRLPVQVAICLFVAMLGWWYRQQYSDSCYSSANWIKLIRKYTSNMEPH